MRTMHPQRRALLTAAALLPLAAHAQYRAEMQVYKTPAAAAATTGLLTYGFTVKATNVTDTAPLRARFGLPAKFGSCHTAMVGGYIVEGLVPVREIRRLLAERPTAFGIAVPEMPIGSPGIDGPNYKGQRDPFDVLLVQADGSPKVYATYN